MSTLSIIVAIAQNGTIGNDNQLLWHISEDLRRFKSITSGHPVIMGRKTFESLGRPLPNRRNIVITRQKDYQAEGCEMAGSLDQAIALCREQEEVFIIGGGEIYRQALPLADKLYLTVVHKDYEGDTHFPEIDCSQWEETFRDDRPEGTVFGVPFSFIDYRRK